MIKKQEQKRNTALEELNQVNDILLYVGLGYKRDAQEHLKKLVDNQPWYLCGYAIKQLQKLVGEMK